MNMNDEELKHFFVHEARVGMSPGIVFGAGGSGFMRMNIGAPKRVIGQALERIARALGTGPGGTQGDQLQ
jgi:cystathionine beta-lyase